MVGALLTGGGQAHAQTEIPVGSWRTHLTYHDARALAITPKRVYCASQSGFFFLDKAEEKTYTLSKVDGLSDGGITALAYHAELQVLIIGYENGNLDLLTADGVTNLSQIRDRDFDHPQINHILTQSGSQLAYLSTGFGIVELDLDRALLRDSYINLGQGGTEIAVFQTAILGDTLFAACEEGLKRASLAPNVNRLDFNVWQLLDTPLKQGITNVVSHQGQVVFSVDYDSIYRYDGGQLEGLAIAPRQDRYHCLASSGEHLLVSLDGYIFILAQDGTFQGYDHSPTNRLLQPLEVMMDSDGTVYYADYQLGLGRFSAAQAQYQHFFPPGTYHKSTYQLRYLNGKIGCAAGGTTPAFVGLGRPYGFYLFENGTWTNYNTIDTLLGSMTISSATDITDLAYRPSDGQLYYGSFAGGLFRYDAATQTATPVGNANLRSGITGMVSDNTGNLWVGKIGQSIENRIYRLSPDNEVTPLGGSSNFQPYNLATDFAGNLWFVSQGTAVAVNDFPAATVVANGNADFDGNVLSLAQDARGLIWIGTDDGLYEITNPAQVADGEAALIRTPFISGSPTMNNSRVLAIAADGGNRLWVGSDDGVRLFDNNASELIHHFTAQNSPLLDDSVHTIAIEPQTGEVFFGTPKGIISYRADATAAGLVHADVKVFPNPVRPGYAGLLAISGLAANANIKITDISGQLIWQGRANGGSIAWNLTDYQGRRASSGIYLVFSSDNDGEETFVAKFAIVE